MIVSSQQLAVAACVRLLAESRNLCVGWRRELDEGWGIKGRMRSMSVGLPVGI